jgi:hypothetical protein
MKKNGPAWAVWVLLLHALALWAQGQGSGVDLRPFEDEVLPAWLEQHALQPDQGSTLPLSPSSPSPALVFHSGHFDPLPGPSSPGLAGRYSFVAGDLRSSFYGSTDVAHLLYFVGQLGGISAQARGAWIATIQGGRQLELPPRSCPSH